MKLYLLDCAKRFYISHPPETNICLQFPLERYCNWITVSYTLHFIIIIIIIMVQAIHGLFRFRILTSELMNLFRHLVGLLGRGISPTQGLYLHRTTQHRKKRTHIHASSGIRTLDPIVRAVEDSTCLRPRGHWDRLHYILNTFLNVSV
jgi:hypothetical protein